METSTFVIASGSANLAVSKPPRLNFYDDHARTRFFANEKAAAALAAAASMDDVQNEDIVSQTSFGSQSSNLSDVKSVSN
jgi:hypothetical protein